MPAEAIEESALPMRPSRALNQHRDAIRAIVLRNRVVNVAAGPTRWLFASLQQRAFAEGS